MTKKSHILLVLFTLSSISVSAQIEADISRPSINAEQFGLAVKAENALNKGQLSLNIPLLELKGKGYNLPISLSFYSGDVTTTTEASPIGLGWSLVAGGVIASTIRGYDDIDEITNERVNNLHNDGNYITNVFRKDGAGRTDFIEDINNDAMPDEYSYSIPGHSGTIDISVDKNKAIIRKLLPDESYIITPLQYGYCITADDGNKFYFTSRERRVMPLESGFGATESTSWFLTRIETTKGGYFDFTYAREDYIDLTSIRDGSDTYAIYETQRLVRIDSDFGYVTFDAVDRDDRGGIRHWTIADSLQSMRICNIELKDKDGHLIKGYELDNSGTFRLKDHKGEDPSSDWYNCRQMLSSITQYDAAGNRLPPYRFTYDYQLSKSRTRYQYWFDGKDSEGNYIPYDSWTSGVGTQAYVDLAGNIDGSRPFCSYDRTKIGGEPGGWTGISQACDGETEYDYLCLTQIDYPTGATDEFEYECHKYSKVNEFTLNGSPASSSIQGRRLASKTSYGSDISLRTEYVYKLHDSDYNTINESSGVLTNPSIHSATYYTLGMDSRAALAGGFALYASRITSGRPFNSFVGTPVCYTEVEEVEKDENENTISRTIHYFEPQIMEAPVNYLLVGGQYPQLAKIENRIFGTISGYSRDMDDWNSLNFTYMAYPVGEFCNIASVVDQPLKEVFIGKDNLVRSVKTYQYYVGDNYMKKKYGYKMVSQNYNYPSTPTESSSCDYTVYYISQSEYITRNVRLKGINTTNYYYDGEKCDSICDGYLITYNKGRTSKTSYTRGDKNTYETKSSQYYYPNDIKDIAGKKKLPLLAINKLIEKNIIADPIETVMRRNGQIVEGECKDYQLVTDTLMPMLKALYKIKDTEGGWDNAPEVIGDSINYQVNLYKEGEILKYDENLNPEYIKLNNTQDRIYVWGYNGRYPIAVIDNMNDSTFKSSNVKSELIKLESYRKIENEDDCNRLRKLNATIRNMLSKIPLSQAHITTYTYDPDFGMTSEMDDSNLGTIYTYDTFGRLTAKYNENYKKIEEYNYHLKLQK